MHQLQREWGLEYFLGRGADATFDEVPGAGPVLASPVLDNVTVLYDPPGGRRLDACASTPGGS